MGQIILHYYCLLIAICTISTQSKHCSSQPTVNAPSKHDLVPEHSVNAWDEKQKKNITKILHLRHFAKFYLHKTSNLPAEVQAETLLL
jgi:hypothetical protein